MKRFSAIAGALLITAATLLTAPAANAQVPNAYATILFGRSGWQPANSDCSPKPGTVDLGTAVAWLYDTEGISAVGGLTTGRTDQSDEFCQDRYILYPSWDELSALQANYGFDLVSQSATYTGWAGTDTTASINAESCDTIQTFKAHGFENSWAMFAPPDNKMTAQQLPIVNGCFAFNRKYNPKIDTQARVSAPPYTVGTLSVTSGNCNNPSRPCYTGIPNGKRYELPGAISTKLQADPGVYNVVQFYRFVTGANSVGAIKWDCTSPNPYDHWVGTGSHAPNSYELYCYNDFQAAVLGHGDVEFTNPATVAQAWTPARAATLSQQ